MANSEDYDISYDEYLAQKSSKNESFGTSEKESESSKMSKTDRSSTDVTNNDSNNMSQLKQNGQGIDDSGNSLVEMVTGETTEATTSVMSSLTPATLLQKGLIRIAQQFGISAKVATIIIAILGSSTFAAFLFGGTSVTPLLDRSDDCDVYDNSAFYNEKYETPDQETRDGYARAMYRILSSKQITKPWVNDDSIKTSTGLLYFPSLGDASDVNNEYNEYKKDALGNLVKDGTGRPIVVDSEYSKAFSTEAIIGMISNADAESGVMPDSYEYNFGVGPKEQESDEDIILSSSHHYNWDIYVKQMFKRYQTDGVSIIQDAYKYTDRQTGQEHLYPGMGFWGWTGCLAYELQEFCDTFDNPWEMNGDNHNDAMYTLSGQLAFLLYSEDWFDYVNTEFPTTPTEVGSLKKFKVDIPDATLIRQEFGDLSEDNLAEKLGVDMSDINSYNMYELCAKLREIIDKWERPWRAYSDEDQLEELIKIREEWDERVQHCYMTDSIKVTAKEWAAVSEVYYETYHWCYYPDTPVSLYIKYPQYPWQERTPFRTENAVNSDGDKVIINKYKGLDGEVRRVESDIPVCLDFGAYDGSSDLYAAIGAYYGYPVDIDKYNQDEKDIWLYDLHVEIIARDRFGRVMKKVSKEENLIENGTITSGVTAKASNGYTLDADESHHTEDKYYKVMKLKKDDDIQYESRVWSESDFDKWHTKFMENWASHWQANYDEAWQEIYTNTYQQTLNGILSSPGYTGSYENAVASAEYAATNAANSGAPAAAESKTTSQAYSQASEVGDKITKELLFDVWGDASTTADDHDSDGDETSAGGLACEVLARDFSLYFEGILPTQEEELEKHMAAASRYYEQYLGTQKRFYQGDPERISNVLYPDESCKFPTEWQWLTEDNLAKSVVELFDKDATRHDNSSLSNMWKENAQVFCGRKVNTSSIADTAVSLCWPKGYPDLATVDTLQMSMEETPHYILRLCTELYVAVKDIVMPQEDPKSDLYWGVTLYSSCDRGAMTSVRASGADPNFYNAFPKDQIVYCENSPLWYDVLNDQILIDDKHPLIGTPLTLKTQSDMNMLKSGDLLISKRHIMVFVGPDAVLEKYPAYGRDAYNKLGGEASLGKTYEDWFRDYYGKYSLVHSSHATQEDVINEGLETSRGLMLQCVSADGYGWITGNEWLGETDDADGYRVFRCVNQDLETPGPKWDVNAKWVTLRNLLKGEIFDSAYKDMIANEREQKLGSISGD